MRSALSRGQRSWPLFTSLAVAAVVHTGCDGDEAGTGTAGGINWSTSAFGASTVAGTGGAGGSAASSGGAGGTSTSTGAGGQAGGPATLLVLAAGPSGALGARFDGQAWATESFSEASDRRPAVAFLGPDTGLLTLRAASVPHSLRFTTWSAGGGFEPWGEVGVQTRDRPALTAGSLVYQGADFKHAYGFFDNAWMPNAEPVGPTLPLQSFGPAAGDVTSLGADVVFAFPGDDGGVYVQRRSNGAWEAAAAIPGAQTDITPAMVALSSGPELMAVWVNDDPGQFDDQKIFFAVRSGGTWSAAAKIDDGVFALEPPALTAVADGGAVLAFRGTDDRPYALRYTGGTWGTVGPVGGTNNPAVSSPPALARGGSGADAELVYVSGGVVSHVRLTAGGWSAPSAIGGSGLTHATIASRP